MFSICTAYIENGKIKETLDNFLESEKKFTKEIGVLFRKFFQCKIQPHIIWSITEWESEKSHNDAAQSIMQIRRDDRFASIAFGPEPYFEIFCEEEITLKIGNFSEIYNYIIIIHGLIGENVKEKYVDLRKKHIEEYREKLQWVSVFHNTYNSNEFITVLGFKNEDSYRKVQKIGELYLEEYLFTGLRNPLGMSYLAAYNQFICEFITI
ncbi:hypothetical protein LCGC14_0494510 [marine sediment metagenome]|uniref:ABM domain-containing protein n=1 Tax=marine sediment metagenome TaxID=412755 RepID=A0A0F9SP27_9ZZZZ|nr:hypothetical protein [archaeon]